MTHRDPIQMSLLQGLDFKESGMRQAIDHAERDWKDLFRDTLSRLAHHGQPFTSEDAVAEAGLPVGQISINRNNAVGALMNAAARQGLIRKTGRRVPSRRPTSHGTEINEWIGVRR